MDDSIETITVKAVELTDFKQFDDAQKIQQIMVEYTRQQMIEGTDYGIIPHTDKPTLLKPGAEKLCRLFKLRPMFTLVESIVNYEQEIFHYHYRCQLFRNGELVGEGDGICSSKEKKYERQVIVCPQCGKTNTICKDKERPVFYCYIKKGGCGAKNIQQSDLKTIKEFDFSLVNTVCKMAQKRALVAVVLITCGASQFFTQDLEDYPEA